MSYAAILAQIKSTLEGVAAVGVVLDYDPHSKDWGEKINFFRHTDHTINGWSITRIAVPGQRSTISQPPHEARTHAISMQGLYEISGSGSTSEAAFQAIVDAVQEAFRNNHKLGGTCSATSAVSGDAIHNDEFGNVWCHHAELSFEVTENV